VEERMNNEEQIEMETLTHCLSLAEEEQKLQAEKQLDFLIEWQNKLPLANMDNMINKFRDVIVMMFYDFCHMPLSNGLSISNMGSDLDANQTLLHLFKQAIVIGYIMGQFSEDNNFLTNIPESEEMDSKDQGELLGMIRRSDSLARKQILEQIINDHPTFFETRDDIL